MQSTPEAFLAIVAPYRDDLVVAAECMFTWDWLADVCAAEGLAFVLGHALAMKAIHVALLAQYDTLITDLELTLVRTAKQHDGDAFHRPRSVPGIGKVLALTIRYEIHDITRFDRVQEFASYARLVKGRKESGGKKFLATIEKRHGKGKALSILAHKIGRAVFSMLSRDTVFSMEKFMVASPDRAWTSHTPKSSRSGPSSHRSRRGPAPAARHEEAGTRARMSF